MCPHQSHFHGCGGAVSQEFFESNVDPDAVAQAKMKKWVSISTRPSKNVGHPNVILGVDTVSRLNSIRNFEESTRSVLIGAVKMKEHTKRKLIWAFG